jgi:hypothetical protein
MLPTPMPAKAQSAAAHAVNMHLTHTHEIAQQHTPSHTAALRPPHAPYIDRETHTLTDTDTQAHTHPWTLRVPAHRPFKHQVRC